MPDQEQCTEKSLSSCPTPPPELFPDPQASKIIALQYRFSARAISKTIINVGYGTWSKPSAFENHQTFHNCKENDSELTETEKMYGIIAS